MMVLLVVEYLIRIKGCAQRQEVYVTWDTDGKDAGGLKGRLLERFPVFAGLKPDELDSILAEAPLLRAPAGTVLFSAKQPCRGFPLLLEGTVRVAKAAPNGREILLYRVDPGQGCVLSGGCLLGHSDYTASGVAETDVTLIAIAPGPFHQLMLAYEPFRQFVFAMYGERLAEVIELVEEVAFRKLDERLAQLLVHRGPLVEGTHQLLADELGSVREIVSRLLRSFEVRGWVRIERERVTVLDPKSLAALARSKYPPPDC
jgi:CRP/FNR family transcriptional regulator